MPPNNLLQISSETLWNEINHRHNSMGGAYKIIAVKDGKRISINRFLGADPEGVLYIGKATRFTNRIAQLKTSIDPTYKGGSHICGRRYKSNPNITKVFLYDMLFIELFPSESPIELENDLLKKYSLKYGEVPPLNAI